MTLWYVMCYVLLEACLSKGSTIDTFAIKSLRTLQNDYPVVVCDVMHSPKRRWMDTVLISMMVFYLVSLVNQLNLRCQQLDILYPAVLKGRQLIHRVSSPGKTMLWLKQGISSYTKRTISYNIYLTKLMVGMNQIHLSPKSNGISITNSIIGCRSYYIPIFSSSIPAVNAYSLICCPVSRSNPYGDHPPVVFVGYNPHEYYKTIYI